MKNGSYDGDANRELLKLYAVAPDMIKSGVLYSLLTKALMELPAPDFYTSMFLVHESLHSLDGVKFLVKLQQLLETCHFTKFWEQLSAWKATPANSAIINFNEVKEFDQAIRKFISLTVAATYSSIAEKQLKELWNLTDKKSFADLVALNGWTIEKDETVVIRAVPAAAVKEAKETQQYPSMEQLAKLIATTNA